MLQKKQAPGIPHFNSSILVVHVNEYSVEKRIVISPAAYTVVVKTLILFVSQ